MVPVKLIQYKLTQILLTYQYDIRYIDHNYYLLHVYATAVSQPNKWIGLPECLSTGTSDIIYFSHETSGACVLEMYLFFRHVFHIII